MQDVPDVFRIADYSSYRHRMSAEFHRACATGHQNRNALDIRSYISDVYHKKNTNFSFIYFFFRWFFVPLRPRNNSDWSVGRFSLCFLIKK